MILYGYVYAIVDILFFLVLPVIISQAFGV